MVNGIEELASIGQAMSAAQSIFGAFAGPKPAPVAAMPAPAVGAPAVGAGPMVAPPNYITLDDGTQDVVDTTYFVQPVGVVGDPALSAYDDEEWAREIGGTTRALRELDTLIYGSPGAALGAPIFAQLRASNPDVFGSGAPLGSILDAFNGVTDRVLGTAGIATKRALESASREINALIKRVQTLEKNTRLDISHLRTMVNNLNTTVRQLTAKWNANYGSQAIWKRTSLAVAQAYPGIKAMRTLRTPALVEFFGIFEDFFSEFEGELTGSALGDVADVGAVFNQAAINGAIEDVQQNVELVADDVAALRGLINELIKAVEKSEARTKSAATFKGFISHVTLIDQAAELAPSQITDQQQAMYEIAAKYLLPRPAAAGTGLLAGAGLAI